jgi:hypothetical protein
MLAVLLSSASCAGQGTSIHNPLNVSGRDWPAETQRLLRVHKRA